MLMLGLKELIVWRTLGSKGEALLRCECFTNEKSKSIAEVEVDMMDRGHETWIVRLSVQLLERNGYFAVNINPINMNLDFERTIHVGNRQTATFLMVEGRSYHKGYPTSDIKRYANAYKCGFKLRQNKKKVRQNQ